jgi:hypothetical protein
MTYTFYNVITQEAISIEADVAPAAVLKAQRILNLPEQWTFDGLPIAGWLDAARLMFGIDNAPDNVVPFPSKITTEV